MLKCKPVAKANATARRVIRFLERRFFIERRFRELYQRDFARLINVYARAYARTRGDSLVQRCLLGGKKEGRKKKVNQIACYVLYTVYPAGLYRASSRWLRPLSLYALAFLLPLYSTPSLSLLHGFLVSLPLFSLSFLSSLPSFPQASFYIRV